jgi:hypothetical protein
MPLDTIPRYTAYGSTRDERWQPWGDIKSVQTVQKTAKFWYYKYS